MNVFHDSVLKNPVFLVGAPRSGTSFLSRTLKRHRAVGFIDEPRLTWRYGNDSKSDMLRPEDAREEVCDHIRKTFALRVREQGKERLVEKTPSNALRLGFMDRVFPDCRFVHIMRNGLDSVVSIRRYWENHAGGVNPSRVRKGVIRQRVRELNLRRAPYYAREVIRRALPKSLSRLAGPTVWGPRVPGLTGLLHDLDLLEVCCLQWRMCVESACHYGRQLPSDRYMECNLENMSPQLVRSILKFCDLDEDPNVMEYVEEHFDPSKPGGRQVECDQKERDTIHRWIDPTLQWLGYTPRDGESDGG